MAETKKDLLNLVAIGKPNPQILNVDFLRSNDILPNDRPPFIELFQREQPFTRFICTPVMATLVFEHIDFLIDEQRFQLRDTNISEWGETPILDIARKYFQVLPHTPLSVVGLNFRTTVTFGNPEQSLAFQELFVPATSKGLSIISSPQVMADVVLRYAYPAHDGRITLTINQPVKARDVRTVNFNYEFDFKDWADFGQRLERTREIGSYADSTLAHLLRAL